MDIAQEAPQTVIMPEDETSLYLQATTQAVWAPRGQTPVVRVHPNREKVSFYGTLNLIEKLKRVRTTTSHHKVLGK